MANEIKELIVDAEIDSGSADGKTIAPGLRADLMRKIMETKNTLKNKGSIYVGTGNKKTISVGTSGDTVEIYETKELLSGGAANYGKVLTVGSDGDLNYEFGATGIQNDVELNLATNFANINHILYVNVRDGLTQEALTQTVNTFKFCTGNTSKTSLAGVVADSLSVQNSSGATYASIQSSGTISCLTLSASSSIASSTFSGGTFSGTSFTSSSDKRLKENIQEFNSNCSILDLPIYKYDFINGPKNQIGCLAQDLREICPEIVQENEDGILSIQESKIVYLLMEEIKNLKQRIEKLEVK